MSYQWTDNHGDNQRMWPQILIAATECINTMLSAILSLKLGDSVTSQDHALSMVYSINQKIKYERKLFLGHLIRCVYNQQKHYRVLLRGGIRCHGDATVSSGCGFRGDILNLDKWKKRETVPCSWDLKGKIEHPQLPCPEPSPMHLSSCLFF